MNLGWVSISVWIGEEFCDCGKDPPNEVETVLMKNAVAARLPWRPGGTYDEHRCGTSRCLVRPLDRSLTDVVTLKEAKEGTKTSSYPEQTETRRAPSSSQSESQSWQAC